jgi:hypothetical protein
MFGRLEIVKQARQTALTRIRGNLILAHRVGPITPIALLADQKKITPEPSMIRKILSPMHLG